MSTYQYTVDLGDLVKVYTDTVFTDADTDTAIDPDIVTVTVTDPDLVSTDYVYGTDDEVVRDDTGDYHFELDCSSAGVWYVRFHSDGDGQAADVVGIRVKNAYGV